MSRRKTPTQAAIARAVKAVISNKLKVARVEIDGERIIVIPAEAAHESVTVTPLAAWKASRGSR